MGDCFVIFHGIVKLFCTIGRNNVALRCRQKEYWNIRFVRFVVHIQCFCQIQLCGRKADRTSVQTTVRLFVDSVEHAHAAL